MEYNTHQTIRKPANNQEAMFWDVQNASVDGYSCFLSG